VHLRINQKETRMHNFMGAIRYSLRQFRLSPVFTAAAVLTLALGIGGTTAIFTLIHAIMFRSLPVADPSGLYRIGDGGDCCVEGGPQDRWGMFSFSLYQRLAAAAPEFEQTTAFQAGWGRLSVRRQRVDLAARPLRSEYVTGTYFSTLGVQPFAGRFLTPGDDQPSAPPVIVMSHHAWEALYAADPSVLGSTFVIEGHPFTVIGIAPPGFFGDTLYADPPDIWIPLQQEPLIAASRSLLHHPIEAWLRIIGRLRPGASVSGMSARLTGVLRQWLRYDSGYPSNWLPDLIRMLPKQVINVVPAGGGVAVMKEQYGRSLEILLIVCAMVLLIACANVANLLLARAVARRRQTAVRLAVGASRRQIIVQALIESIVLAIVGSIAGLFVAAAAARLLLRLAFRSAHFLPIAAGPSFIVLAFAFGLALLTGIIFGAAPAWFATRTHPIEALRAAGRSSADHSSFAREALLIVQAAFSIVLVAGAAMLARSFDNLEHQDFGYRIAHRVLVSINAPPATYSLPKLEALYRRIEARLGALPGVQAGGLAMYNPLTDNWSEWILVSGHPIPKMSEQAGASWDRVSANYLQSLGVKLTRGRYFTPADNEHAELVAIVNQAFVKRFFKPGEDPLNQHFGLDLPENANTFRIVGIVRDARFAGWDWNQPPKPMFYVPLAQIVPYKNPLMIRLELQTHFIGGILLVTSASPGALQPLLIRTLAGIDPNLTIDTIRTMQQQVDLTFDQQRALAGLASLFGIVALLLAAIGLYGVTVYTVARRTSEIGIRMALGAGRGKVLRLVLNGAFRRVFTGLVIGLPLAVAAGRLISAQLYGISSWDPFALLAAAAALCASGFLAALIPAVRAASISPMDALRVE
jgi:predicted permease